MCTFPLSAPGAGLVTTTDRTCVGTDIGGAQGIRRCSNRGITGHVMHDGVSGKPLKRGCSKSLVQSPQGSIPRRHSATPMSPWGRGTRLRNEIKVRAADAMKPNTFIYLHDNKPTRTHLTVAAPGGTQPRSPRNIVYDSSPSHAPHPFLRDIPSMSLTRCVPSASVNVAFHISADCDRERDRGRIRSSLRPSRPRPRQSTIPPPPPLPPPQPSGWAAPPTPRG